jgi:hypothetical protein
MVPSDKKELSKKVEKDLIKNYGQKKYYSKAMAGSAMRRQSISPDWSFWSYSLFMSRIEFEDIHRRLGENCVNIMLTRAAPAAWLRVRAPGKDSLTCNVWI